MSDELVEVWLKQFDDKYFKMSTVKLDVNIGKYRPRENMIGNDLAEKQATIINNMLSVWMEAKRSQPSVDMSLGQVVILNDFDRGYNQAIADACIRLTAAGIKYTIGELLCSTTQGFHT